MVITLAGQEFRITSDSEEQYMRELEAEVNRRIKQIQDQYPMESTTRCTLLAMLNMSDEIIKLHKEYDEVVGKISELRSLRTSPESAVQAPVKRPFERASASSRKPVGV